MEGREEGTSTAICIVLHCEPVISCASVFDPSGSSCLRAHYSSIVLLARAGEQQPSGRYVSKPSQNGLERIAFPSSPLNIFACFILRFRDPKASPLYALIDCYAKKCSALIRTFATSDFNWV